MDIKRIVTRLANRIERTWDRLRPREAPDRPVLDAYRGYAVPGGIVLRGRVLAALRRTSPDPESSRWQNLRQIAKLFLTHEVRDVRVLAPEHDASTVSDEEGYLTLCVTGAFPPGWARVPVEVAGDPGSRKDFVALVPRDEARLGVISDIDDTMMETGAYSLARNLWTTFTGSALTRRVFPDAIVLMDYLTDHGRNPVWYVSSSPWNLHAFLEKVFDRAGLLAGPMFLRDLGIGENKLITGGHGDHKGRAIDTIMTAMPDLPFVLIGDTGQKDAQIYLEACHRHGGRVRAVVLREAGGPGSAAAREAMASLRRLGVTVVVAADFSEAPGALDRDGLVP